MSLTECPEPPKVNEYEAQYEYSVESNRYFLNTTVNYISCRADNYELYPEDVTDGKTILTCGRNGQWSPETAPACGLSEFFLTKIKQNYNVINYRYKKQ